MRFSDGSCLRVRSHKLYIGKWAIHIRFKQIGRKIRFLVRIWNKLYSFSRSPSFNDDDNRYIPAVPKVSNKNNRGNFFWAIFLEQKLNPTRMHFRRKPLFFFVEWFYSAQLHHSNFTKCQTLTHSPKRAIHKLSYQVSNSPSSYILNIIIFNIGRLYIPS